MVFCLKSSSIYFVCHGSMEMVVVHVRFCHYCSIFQYGPFLSLQVYSCCDYCTIISNTKIPSGLDRMCCKPFFILRMFIVSRTHIAPAPCTNYDRCASLSLFCGNISSASLVQESIVLYPRMITIKPQHILKEWIQKKDTFVNKELVGWFNE